MLRCLILFILCASAAAQELPFKQVWIENKPWNIHAEISLDRFDPECAQKSGCVTLGFTVCPKKEITVMTFPPVGLDDQQTVVIHEIQHAIENCSQRVTTQHQAIYDTSAPLVRVLRDKRNRNLVRWLLSE